MEQKNEVVYEIKEHIGVIAQYQTGWQKEINLVSWNGNTAKYDIRDWDEEHVHMSRGITLSESEIEKVRELLDDRAREGKGKAKQERLRVKEDWER